MHSMIAEIALHYARITSVIYRDHETFGVLKLRLTDAKGSELEFVLYSSEAGHTQAELKAISDALVPFVKERAYA